MGDGEPTTRRPPKRSPDPASMPMARPYLVRQRCIPMIRRLITAFSAAAMIASLMASVALAGEVTGNGKSLQLEDRGKWGTGLHGRSFCAFSGQEDLQYEDEEGNPLEEIHKGDPGHAQSWGQIPKFVRDEISQFGFHPGDACNPNVGPPPEG